MSLIPPAVGLLFPGQGTQWVGMGSGLFRQYAEARQAFAEADAALGESVASLCFDGPESALAATVNAQPAIVTCSVAAWRVVATRLSVPVVGAAGHSLGEFSALVAAGALTLADGVRLVRARGHLMEETGRRNGGAGMLAVLGLDQPEAEVVASLAAEQSGSPVSLANVNCPGQVVFGGAVAGLDAAADIARAHGAKRAQRLPISVASHTPLMHDAAERLSDLAASLEVAAPAYPVVGNGSATALSLPDDIRHEIGAQLEMPLNWPACVASLQALGPHELWEVGPKSVLAGLCKRMPAAPPVRTLVTLEEITALLAGTMEG